MSSFVLSVSHPGFSDVLLSPRVKILNGSGGISGADRIPWTYYNETT